MKYVIEIESAKSMMWVAPWVGDPGRTLKHDNAQKFKTKKSAQKEVERLQTFYPERNFTYTIVTAEASKKKYYKKSLPTKCQKRRT